MVNFMKKYLFGAFLHSETNSWPEYISYGEREKNDMPFIAKLYKASFCVTVHLKELCNTPSSGFSELLCLTCMLHIFDIYGKRAVSDFFKFTKTATMLKFVKWLSPEIGITNSATGQLAPTEGKRLAGGLRSFAMWWLNCKKAYRFSRPHPGCH